MEVFGGDGGDGCMSFAKYPHVEFAGPDGGDGGNGGHVIFIGETNNMNILFCKEANHFTSLLFLQKRTEQNCHPWLKKMEVKLLDFIGFTS